MTKTLCRFLVSLATVGLILPYGLPASAASLHEGGAGISAPVDVVLTDGMLRGQLLDKQGSPASNASVAAVSGERVVQRTATDAEGKFALRLDQGGVYLLAANDSSSIVRAWTKAAAPPSAKAAVLLVAGQNVERGRLGDRLRCGRGCLDWNNSCLRTGIAVAAIAGIATAIVLAVDDDAS